MHPREMTLEELEALPVVDRLFRRAFAFVDHDGARWGVGAAGPDWVRAPGEEPPASTARRVEAVRRLATARLQPAR